jgi:signal transduction histidine kinase/CheY-like chemotaxis protein/HPt (histidine-containing phosphotransfer) domain-containing protein
MHTFIKKIWGGINRYAQVLLVWVAFLLMVVTSYFFVGNIVRKHLKFEVMAALDFSEAQITADMMEPYTLMGSISETIRSMILRGESSDMVSRYMIDISNNVIRNKDRKLSSTGIYGFFEVFGNKFLDEEWMPPADYIPQERPWYKTAVAAEGKIAITPPYLDIRTKSITIAYVVRIFDDDNNPQAVLSMNVPIDRIAEYIVETHLAEGGYGLLLSENLEVIAHPYKEGLGKHLREWHSGLAGFADELERGERNIAERRLINYRNDESIVSLRRLENGWYMGIVTPYGKYYQDVKDMMVWFIALGLTLAVTLSFIFLRITTAKTQSDIKNRQKSNFLATMSHEIRTPMNSILGITEIQLQDETLPQGVKDAFYKISNSGDLLIGIINDILDMSKIEAGKLELLPTKYDVPSLINDTVQLNILRFESKPIEFKLLVDENVPMELIGDELRIKQILNNLLSNAFKYTESGEVLLSISAEYVTRGGAVHVTLVFRVTDTGQGMTAEQVRKLGNEYSRFNMEANRTTEGTGLGMSITWNLVQLMYGTISVDSKPGKGTTVTVRLPQKNIGIGLSRMVGKELAKTLRQSRINSVSKIKRAKITREPMPYGKVLIVDDVESNLYVAKGLMTFYELSIDTAVSGFEVIEKIKDGNIYDVIFMDHMMPIMDGIETTKIIRGLGYKHPIVALTANAIMGQAEIFLENGFDGFISKPIDMRQLNASLNKLIRDKQTVEVIEAARRQRDASELRKDAGNKADFSVDPQLKNIFARDAEKAVSELEILYEKRNAWKDDDIHMYIITVHAMKSALANIGETELSGFAFRLEQAGRERNTAFMADETPAFLNSLQEVIKKIKSKEDAGDSGAVDEDKAYLKEKFLVIQTACATYNKKAAKNVLSELRQKKWSRSTKELLNAITEHLLHSEFEEAADIVKKYYKDSADNAG